MRNAAHERHAFHILRRLLEARNVDGHGFGKPRGVCARFAKKFIEAFL
jgi:hypothetical protein